jgi:DUF4097 and DUF4098 domain-containing protein YvlB
MKTSIVLKVASFALLTALGATLARADAEDKITKTFKVKPGGELVIEADRGSIEVKTADAESVDIEVTRKAGGTRSKADQILRDHVVTISQEGDKVEIHAEYKGGKLSGWFGGLGRDLQVKFLVTVPHKFDADLKTAGGSITVGGLTGKLQAATSGGSLKFEQIEGPVTGRTSGGSITLTGGKGKVELKTSGGSIRLSEIEGDVSALTSGGSIHADHLAGKAVVKTSGGGIEVSALKGQIEAGTSGGSITTSLKEQPSGACSFKTSGGGITVVLGEKVAVDIDARTSGGRVTSDLPVVSVVQGEQKKNELQGKINGGGPLITAHTSGGSVHLRKD